MCPLNLFKDFYSVIGSDHRINTAHISLYMALLFYLQQNNDQDPVAVSRTQLMELSKTSRTTYQKCINELDEYGYIIYMPSYDRKGCPLFYVCKTL